MEEEIQPLSCKDFAQLILQLDEKANEGADQTGTEEIACHLFGSPNFRMLALQFVLGEFEITDDETKKEQFKNFLYRNLFGDQVINKYTNVYYKVFSIFDLLVRHFMESPLFIEEFAFAIVSHPQITTQNVQEIINQIQDAPRQLILYSSLFLSNEDYAEYSETLLNRINEIVGEDCSILLSEEEENCLVAPSVSYAFRKWSQRMDVAFLNNRFETMDLCMKIITLFTENKIESGRALKVFEAVGTFVGKYLGIIEEEKLEEVFIKYIEPILNMCNAINAKYSTLNGVVGLILRKLHENFIPLIFQGEIIEEVTHLIVNSCVISYVEELKCNPEQYYAMLYDFSENNGIKDIDTRTEAINFFIGIAFENFSTIDALLGLYDENKAVVIFIVYAIIQRIITDNIEISEEFKEYLKTVFAKIFEDEDEEENVSLAKAFLSSTIFYFGEEAELLNVEPNSEECVPRTILTINGIYIQNSLICGLNTFKTQEILEFLLEYKGNFLNNVGDATFGLFIKYNAEEEDIKPIINEFVISKMTEIGELIENGEDDCHDIEISKNISIIRDIISSVPDTISDFPQFLSIYLEFIEDAHENCDCIIEEFNFPASVFDSDAAIDLVPLYANFICEYINNNFDYQFINDISRNFALFLDKGYEKMNEEVEINGESVRISIYFISVIIEHLHEFEEDDLEAIVFILIKIIQTQSDLPPKLIVDLYVSACRAFCQAALDEDLAALALLIASLVMSYKIRLSQKVMDALIEKSCINGADYYRAIFGSFFVSKTENQEIVQIGNAVLSGQIQFGFYSNSPMPNPRLVPQLPEYFIELNTGCDVEEEEEVEE